MNPPSSPDPPPTMTLASSRSTSDVAAGYQRALQRRCSRRHGRDLARKQHGMNVHPPSSGRQRLRRRRTAAADRGTSATSNCRRPSPTVAPASRSATCFRTLLRHCRPSRSSRMASGSSNSKRTAAGLVLGRAARRVGGYHRHATRACGEKDIDVHVVDSSADFRYAEQGDWEAL